MNYVKLLDLIKPKKVNEKFTVSLRYYKIIFSFINNSSMEAFHLNFFKKKTIVCFVTKAQIMFPQI